MSRNRDRRPPPPAPQAEPVVETAEPVSPQPEPMAEALEAFAVDEGSEVTGTVEGTERIVLEGEAGQAFLDMLDAPANPTPELITLLAPDPLPRAKGSLPGSLLCVVSHGTVRRDGVEYGMGEPIELPAAEAEALRAAGVVR